MPNIKDISGKRFGKVTALTLSKRTGNGIKKITYWTCICDCGNKKDIQSGSLIYGSVKSCGCGMKVSQFKRTHNMSNTREYRCWLGMRKRCVNSDGHHRTYVEKNITVCEEWQNSFEAFFSDIGKCPSNKHTVERIDNDKGYSKDNCIWATSKEQTRNYSQNRIITLNGESMCVTDWAEKLGISRGLIYNRLNLGWNAERTLTPIQ